jgi:ComF family protein
LVDGDATTAAFASILSFVTTSTLLVGLPGLALRALVDLCGRSLAPDSCAGCDGVVARATIFCRACAATVTRAAPTEPVVAFAEFGGAVAQAIRRLKYASRPDLARPLAELLRHAARDASLCADLLVPVPLHPRRLAERGYNQAALLARPLALELGARFAPRALRRCRDTPRQVTLERAARRANVAAAFVARTPGELGGRRVVLVDDVVTTGATLHACRSALLAAGAASVVCVVVARAG